MFAHACKLGLEGVVSKVRDSAYASGRGNSWVKKTCAQRETLTIAGFALDEGQWDGIYLGRRKGDDLIYAGKVDHGFDKTSAADLQKRLKPLIRKAQRTPSASRTRASGSSRSFWPRSSIERGRPQERSGTRSSSICGRICNAMVRCDKVAWSARTIPICPWLGDHACCGAGATAATSRMADIT
jgi:hypothetical protein